MPNSEILDKNITVNNGEAIITKTVKEVYSRDDLIHKKEDAIRRKGYLIQQSNDLKKQYDKIISEITDYENMITQLGATEVILATEEAELIIINE